MKKIPYGIIDYKTLILEDYKYVDKTMYLEKLENVGKTLFYLRPGRFGKSLFTSMIGYYYDINSKDLFDSLFKDTYVYENPTKEKNSYYVLKFDFSAIESANKNNEKLSIAFKNKVISGIKGFNNQYDTNIIIDGSEDTPEILDSFIRQFQALKLNHKIYIIIDEYDNFTNAILEGSADRFKSVVGNEGLIKAFYASIKEYVKVGVVGRFFATGICPITLDAMTTGFNIATNISRDVRFNSMIGLTHEEVKDLLEQVVDEKDRDNIYELMVKNYDGYLFSKDATERVFNATLVMYLLNYYEAFKKVPDELMDKNIVFNSNKIQNLIELQNNSFYRDLLNEIIEKNQIKGILKSMFDLTIELDRNDILSLLYYFGYLTIEKDQYGGYYFVVPNEVMKFLYGNYFVKKLKQNGITYNYTKISEIIEELIQGKINLLNDYVCEILEKLDNRDFIKLDEKMIKIIYFTILLENGYFNIYSEQVSNHGYIDIYLEKKNPNILKNIMIELKYIKKQDYSDKLLEEKRKEAKEQLINYSKDERLGDVCRYLVIFVGNDLKILEEV